jgi:hypothetical protein
VKRQRPDNEVRKAEIRRRLNIEKYSKPENIVYTDENDHNPLVLEKCPDCRGTGKNCYFVETEMTYYTDVCSTCDGDCYTGELVRQFDNDAKPLEASLNSHGWVTCPGCGTRFTVTNKRSWSGRRHLKCGQKIILCGAAPK